jgi:hypothetical protein
MRLVLIALGLLLAAVVPSSAAASPTGPEVSIDETGDPRLWAGPASFEVPVSWRRCTESGCVRLSQATAVLRPGLTPAGTHFELTFTPRWGGSPMTWASPTWLGRQTPIESPALVGNPLVGEPVSARAGTFSGGWTGHGVGARVLHCATAAGEHCETLTGTDGALVGPAHVGKYLFVESRRSGPYSTVPPLIEDLEPPAAYRSLAGPYGPISAPPAPPAPVGQPAPPPAAPRSGATLRARVLRERGRLVVGRVRCEARCKVDLRVSDGRRTVKRSFTTQGSTALRVGKALRRGRLTVTVTIDGKPAAFGKVRHGR